MIHDIVNDGFLCTQFLHNTHNSVLIFFIPGFLCLSSPSTNLVLSISSLIVLPLALCCYLAVLSLSSKYDRNYFTSIPFIMTDLTQLDIL